MFREMRFFWRQVIRQAALQSEPPKLPPKIKESMLQIIWGLSAPYEGPELDEEALDRKMTKLREGRPLWKKAAERIALATMRAQERVDLKFRHLWQAMRRYD